MKNLWKISSKKKFGKFVFQQSGSGDNKDISPEDSVDGKEKGKENNKPEKNKAKEMVKKYSLKSLIGILKFPGKAIKSITRLPHDLAVFLVGVAMGTMGLYSVQSFFKDHKMNLTTKEKKDYTIVLDALRTNVFKIGTAEIEQGLSFRHTFKDTLVNNDYFTIENPFTERTLKVLSKGKGLMGFDSFIAEEVSNEKTKIITITVPEPKIISMETTEINFETKEWFGDITDEEQAMMTIETKNKLKEKMNHDLKTKKIAEENFREYISGIYELQGGMTNFNELIIDVNVKFISQEEFDSLYGSNPNVIKNNTKIITVDDFKD